MKPTPIPLLCQAAGFASPENRRKAAQHVERFKQVFDERHPLHNLEKPYETSRLKSRKRFMRKRTTSEFPTPTRTAPRDESGIEDMDMANPWCCSR